MNATDPYIWLAVGLLPYRLAHKRLADGSRLVEIQALFWTFDTRRPPKGPRSWTLHVILIERLRDTAWAVLDQLRGRPGK